MPLCCLLHSPLQKSYGCDAWLAVGHRGNLHPPKLQQVHGGAETALTWRAVMTHFYDFWFFIVWYFKCCWLSLKLFVCARQDVYKVWSADDAWNESFLLSICPSFLLHEVQTIMRDGGRAPRLIGRLIMDLISGIGNTLWGGLWYICSVMLLRRSQGNA